jgi:hypothetical protein
MRPGRLAPALLVLVGAGGVLASAHASPTGPAGLKEEVVLSDALVDGNRLDLTRFTDARAPWAVLAAVRSAWSLRPAPLQEDARNGWHTLTQAVGEAVEILEVREAAAGGSEGRRSRWRRAPSGAAEAGAWLAAALPPGSRVLQQLAHRDGGREMTTVVAVTEVAMASASRQVVAALARVGFGRSPRASPSFSAGAGGEAFFLTRRAEEVAVTVSEVDGRRAVVIHWGRPAP